MDSHFYSFGFVALITLLCPYVILVVFAILSD